MDEILRALQERAKELNCLYRVDEILNRTGIDQGDAMRELVESIPRGWQYPDACVVKVILEGRVFHRNGFTEDALGPERADPLRRARSRATLSVYYTERRPNADEGPFLKEERRLINTIAERIGYFLLQRKLRSVLPEAQAGRSAPDGEQRWSVILDFLRGTDRGAPDDASREG